MSETRENTTQGVSTLGLLGVAFVILKLTHVIGWSWWWVTAPFWGGLAVAAVAILVVLILAGIAAVAK